MNQLSFADTEFTSKRRKTRKELFLSRMDELIPWQQLEDQIEPFYPKAGNGRRPYPLSTMLRIHFMQNWYNMGDPAMEDALYEITSMRLFAGLSLEGAIPDRTTIMNFRHLLEKISLDVSTLKKSTNGYQIQASTSKKAPSLTRRLLKPLARPKIKPNHVTQKCIRPRKEINGSLG